MSRLLVSVLGSLATIGLNGPAAAVELVAVPRIQIAQQSTGPAPVGAPGSTSSPNPFPSSSASGSAGSNSNRNEAYFAAMRKCQSLPSAKRPDCIDETKKKFGEM
jgi:hypothetical protein